MTMVAGNDNWNGARTTLAQFQYVNMPQTPNGSLILGYLNQAKQNTDGEIMVTSGGSQPRTLPVPALIQMLSLLVNNWQANNLKVTNTSTTADAPILVQAFGPGIPGAAPVNLPIGQTIALGVAQAAQGTSEPRNMILRLTASTGNLSIVGIVGGPPYAGGNNAYVVALNATDGAPPPGYYATTASSSYTFSFNWGSATVYVANLSPIVQATVSATMQAL